MRLWGIAALVLIALSSCTVNEGTPPLVLDGHRPPQLARERAYVACATALYRAHSPRQQLRLRQRYKSVLRDEPRVRVFHLGGTIREGDERKEVEFMCYTQPFGKVQVLGVGKTDPRPGG